MVPLGAKVAGSSPPSLRSLRPGALASHVAVNLRAFPLRTSQRLRADQWAARPRLPRPSL